jgi:hypothetical protein
MIAAMLSPDAAVEDARKCFRALRRAQADIGSCISATCTII